MRISVLTLFPEVMQPYLDASILGRAGKAGLLQVCFFPIRDYSLDKHKRTDDYPFGGGAGLIMTPQPVFDAVAAARKTHSPGCRVIYLSPQGRRLTHRVARELAQERELILLCGHYEGIDQRIIDELVDEEISIGDYVLTGGELPALVLIDSVSRFVPGVVGNENVHDDESFEQGLLEYPHYTRPADFRGLTVPDVLLSGHHANIQRWRSDKALEKTRLVRPDLLEEKEGSSSV
ncbi:MAG: tRNA (guanosine(37)-N1)-methyltransferase TrmD [Eubacteriales bacterium]|nr:tRNA (guanosine(37)-N1)-methyltransferase TrmD [Eubacteriales bacterium]